MPAPSALNVVTATLGMFLVVLTLLALHVRSGTDPSLSSSASGAVSTGSGSTGSGATAATAKKLVTRTS